MNGLVSLYRVLTFIFLVLFITAVDAAQPPDKGNQNKNIPQSALIDLSANGARIHRPTAKQRALTKPTRQPPALVIKNYLRTKQFQNEVLSSLVVSKENTDAKRRITHLQMEQKLNGLKIYGAYVKASVRRNGELIQLIENVVTPQSSVIHAAEITAQQALNATIARHYPNLTETFSIEALTDNTTTFAKDNFFYSNPTVTLVAIPYRGNVLEQGYLVQTWDKDNILRHTLVNRFGRIINVELRTNYDSYNIFPDNPDTTPQSIVAGPGAGNTESPIGWVFSDTTTGNNVDAYLDTDDNNLPDVGGRPVSATQDFLTVADLTVSPSTPSNQMVGTQNLFYLNNVIHDLLYQHGFNEAAGNFQEDNFSLGGLGSDSVNAEAQDGGGTNNANFATPPDGSNPRMQMYIWTPATPDRDGDLESDIVFHEYGHGLTWRMIGNMSGPLSGAIGEGMSDALAILINEDDIMGAWSLNDPGGIRRYPYTDYPLTYGDVAGFSVHQDGEIYAAAIWRLWELWQLNSLPKDLLFDYLIQGMNYTPPGPAYEDMRDGILAAITNLEHQCLVWEAFAQFGIGDGADGQVIGGSVSITESFTVAPECFEDDPIPPDAVTDLAVSTVDAFSATLTWTATGDDGMIGNATSYDLRYSTAAITAANFDAATQFTGTPTPGAPGTAETTTVTGLTPDTTYYFAIKVIDNVLNNSAISNVVNATTNAVTTVFSDDMESGDGNWTITGTIGPTGLPLWHLATHRSNSPTTAFYYGVDATLNYNTGAANNGQITSVPISLADVTDSTLRFYHFLENENFAPYDAASVEVSNDGGASWAQVFLTSIGTGGLMVEELIDLSLYDGQTIQLRFSFDTVDSVANSFEGWVVDDVAILGSSIGDLPPTANPGGPYGSGLGQAIIFDGTGSTDPESMPLTYNWDFGDGTIVNDGGPTPSHTYAATGVYTVTLVVNDGTQDSTPAVTSATVALPVADPGGPYSGGVTQPISFDGSASSGTSGNPLNYQWDFGDGNTGVGVNPTHSYTTAGNYTVTLVVDDGFTPSLPVTANASIALPVANPGGPYNGFVGQTIIFDGSGSSGTSGNPLNYQWDFGDGNTGVGVNPSHAYAATGAYTITLVVEDGYTPSLPVQTTASITVVPNVPPVITDVTATPSSILDTETSLLQVLANDPDSGPAPLSYNWIVPAGQGSVDDPTSATPTFTPADVTAIETVVITVEVSDGEATVSDTVTVTVQDPGSTSLLIEDFNDGDFTGWSIVDEATLRGPSIWSAVSGTMVQSSNIYSNPTDSSPEKPGSYALYDNGMGWTNYRSTFTMQSGDNDAIGFMFRTLDSNNYYRFAWDRERSYRRLVKRVAGVTTILQEDSVPYVSGQNYEVEITALNNQLQVRIDGALIFDVTDSDLNAGSIALYVWGNTASRFDDITVENLALGNISPVIHTVTATAAVILDTETSALAVNASDLDNGPAPLSYNWIVPAGQGSVDNPNSATPTYTPANVFTTEAVLITVEVSDGSITVSDTITVTVEDAGAAPPLLVEDFNDGNFAGWSIVDEGTIRAPSDWTAVTGAMMERSNIYSNPTDSSPEKPGSYALYDSGLGWSNYRTTFTMKSGDDDAIGFMFRTLDSNNYYRFSWDRERSYRRLVKRVAGVTTILQEDAVAYNVNQTYQVEITASGDQLQVRIDGVLVFDVTDTDLNVGSIALYVWGNSPSTFDDIIVEGL